MKFLCLLTLIIHESSIIRVRRQRKLRITQGQNHFNLNFILTYNIYTFLFPDTDELKMALRSKTFPGLLRNGPLDTSVNKMICVFFYYLS